MRFYFAPVPNKYTVQIVKPSGEVYRIEFQDSTRAEALRVIGR